MGVGFVTSSAKSIYLDCKTYQTHSIFQEVLHHKQSGQVNNQGQFLNQR